MEQYADRALNAAKQLGAQYADVRIVERFYDGVVLKNREIDGVVSTHSYGMGVRVLVDGFLGFAANPDMTEEKIATAVQRAVDIARASSVAGGEPTTLSPEEPQQGSWSSPWEEDPFQVSLEEKINILMACEDAMQAVKGVRISRSSMNFLRERKFFASTEGSRIHQEVLQSGAGIQAFATDGKALQVRSYPAAFGGQYENAGFEMVRRLAMPDHATRVAEEAVALLTAPQCPSGPIDIILGGSQLALQVHESCGHAVELDRIFGMEANYAGMSFLTAEKHGNFRYGSDIVNLTADATMGDGLGGYGWDDEGVPGRRTELVKNGIFTNYISSRDTASRIGVISSGNARAEDWNALPLVRMSNINLEPGDISYEDLIASTKRGILVSENRSWSIDDKRLNFQFGMELGYMIEDGKITGIVKNPTYTGITPEFWQSCDAIANKDSWHIVGVPNCGKGQPPQTMRVAHGVSFARFRNVKAGVGYDQ